MNVKSRLVLAFFAAIVSAGLAANNVSATTRGAVVTDIDQPLVEDYSYPGAAQIQAEHNLDVSSGDGHITFIQDCESSTDTIVIETFAPGTDGRNCFSVVGRVGVLRLRIPNVYLVWSGNNALRATFAVDGTVHTVSIRANDLAAIGATSSDAATLMELRVGEPY